MKQQATIANCGCAYSLTFRFEGAPTHLDYLSGKTFSIPREEIYFVKELFS